MPPRLFRTAGRALLWKSKSKRRTISRLSACCCAKPRTVWWLSTRFPGSINPSEWRNTNWFARFPNHWIPICPVSRKSRRNCPGILTGKNHHEELHSKGATLRVGLLWAPLSLRSLRDQRRGRCPAHPLREEGCRGCLVSGMSEAKIHKGYKRTQVGVIPEDWDIKSVNNIASIKTGPFGTLLKASEYSDGNGVPLISVGEIREG